MRVETGGSDEQVTAYAHHWRESVYERQDVLVVKKLRVRRSRGHILPHEDLVDGGAFEVGPGRVRPGWSMHFVDGNGQRYKPMDAFFHERPTGVSVHGRVIEVVYALKKDRPLKSGSAQVDVKRNRWKVRARDEFGGAEYLQVVPVSSEKHWGIRMSCFEPAGLSILVIATEKGISFHQAMGQSAPELLYLHAMEKAQSLALMQDGFSTLFVNGEPRLRLEGCAPTDYEPTAIGTDGQRVSLNVLRKTIE